jgi:hypothetical protein
LPRRVRSHDAGAKTKDQERRLLLEKANLEGPPLSGDEEDTIGRS